MDREKYTTIVIHPHVGIDISEAEDEFVYPNYTMMTPEKKLAVSIFDAYPVQGKRVVTMTVQVEGEKVSLVFSGNLWPFRSQFDAQQIPMYRDENGKVFRAVEDCDVDFAKCLPELFNNGAARVVVDGAVRSGTQAHAFIKELKENPQLHFV